MRVLIAILVTAFIVGGILLARKELGPAATMPEALPDSLRFPDDETLRDRLIEGVFGGLDMIKTKYPDDMLLAINCDVAKTRVAEDYATANVSPFMLGASLMPRGGQPLVLAFHALNLDRETDRLLIVGRTRDGALLRVVYHFNITHKDPSLVAQRMALVQKVSAEEIERLGDVKRTKSGAEVHLPFRFNQLPMPDISPLAAAVEDRSGRPSNFVPVLEAASDTGQPE